MPTTIPPKIPPSSSSAISRKRMGGRDGSPASELGVSAPPPDGCQMALPEVSRMGRGIFKLSSTSV
jgi:hypothetical protein